MSKIECILAPIYTPKLIKIVTTKHIMPKKHNNIDPILYASKKGEQNKHRLENHKNDGPVIIFHQNSHHYISINPLLCHLGNLLTSLSKL
jgi:hypothetical protein